MTSIYKAAETYRHALLEQESTALDALATAYDATREKIVAQIDALEKDIERLEVSGQDDTATAHALTTRWQGLLPQVNAELASLAKQGALITKDGQVAMITAGTGDALRSLVDAAMGEKPAGVDLVWNRLPVQTLTAYAGFASDGSPLATVFQDAGGDFAGQLSQLVFDGLAMGDNARVIAATMRSLVNSPSYAARFEVIARTEMARAQREATRQEYAANPDVVDSYTRLSARDSRVCPACWALDGTTYNTSEIMPTHACCRCCMVPNTASWADITGDDSIPDTRPAIEPADDAFAGLDEEEQAEVLGPARFALYQDGTPLSAFAVVENDDRWGPTCRVATLEELGKQ